MEQTDPVEMLFARAKAHRIPMAAICHRANIAETTPSRWRRNRNGATLESVNRLTDALSEIIAEQSSRPADAQAAA